MSEQTFENQFHTLTGHRPLSWQTRLYHRLAAGDLPEIIDLPTGMGKTMVMAVWLIARSLHPGGNLPTRLIYVVDRRTVVDRVRGNDDCSADPSKQGVMRRTARFVARRATHV